MISYPGQLFWTLLPLDSKLNSSSFDFLNLFYSLCKAEKILLNCKVGQWGFTVSVFKPQKPKNAGVESKAPSYWLLGHVEQRESIFCIHVKGISSVVPSRSPPDRTSALQLQLEILMIHRVLYPATHFSIPGHFAYTGSVRHPCSFPLLTLTNY